MSLAKGLLKVTHDILAKHIAEGVAHYIKTHVHEILPKTLNQLDKFYDIADKNEDVNFNCNNEGSYYYTHTVKKNAEKMIHVSGHHKQHVMCKSMDYQIDVDGVTYAMMPVQVQDKSGKMHTMLAYVQKMEMNDDEEHIQLVVSDK